MVKFRIVLVVFIASCVSTTAPPTPVLFANYTDGVIVKHYSSFSLEVNKHIKKISFDGQIQPASLSGAFEFLMQFEYKDHNQMAAFKMQGASCSSPVKSFFQSSIVKNEFDYTDFLTSIRPSIPFSFEMSLVSTDNKWREYSIRVDGEERLVLLPKSKVLELYAWVRGSNFEFHNLKIITE